MRDGRVPPARHARHPAARRVDLLRAVRDPELQRRRSRASSRNTTPTDAYRGAGRPEATYVIERTMDALARELGMDPVELRRKNFIKEFPAHDGVRADDRLRRLRRVARPAARASSTSTRSARSRRSAARAATRSSSASASRRTTRCAASRRRGSSARSATRSAAGTRRRSASCRLGSVQVVTGTSPHGQGHETTWAQIVADQLGVDIDDVEVLHGDTAVSQLGMDTYGSRSLAVGGVALCNAAEKVIDEGAADRRAPARGLRGRPRVRERDVHA